MGFFNFENKPIRFTEQPLLNNPKKRKEALEYAKKVDSYRPDPNEFISANEGYTEKQVERDLREVFLLQEHWSTEPQRKKTAHEVARVYEALCVDQLETNAWLGDIWFTYPTAEFDDYKTGIDAVLIPTESDNAFGGIGIDCTFSTDANALSKKMNSIEAVIRNGSVPSIKYQIDPNTDQPIHEQLPVAKVILGAHFEKFDKLVTTWINKDAKNRNQRLQSDPTSTIFLLEALWQTHHFKVLATKCKNETAVALYEQAYTQLHEVLEKKQQQIARDRELIQEDPVFIHIAKHTKSSRQRQT